MPAYESKDIKLVNDELNIAKIEKHYSKNSR